MQISLQIPPDMRQFLEIGRARATYDRYGDVKRLYLNVSHTKMHLYKEISGVDVTQLQMKLDELLHSWNKKYQSLLSQAEATAAKEIAETIVSESEARRESMASLLKHTLSVDDAVEWSALLTHKKWTSRRFSLPKPEKPKYPVAIEWNAEEYTKPKIPWLLYFQSDKIRENHLKRFEERQKRNSVDIEKKNEETAVAIRKLQKGFQKEMQNWKAKKTEWEAKQAELEEEFENENERHNIKVKQLEADWKKGNADSVIEHADIVLGASKYPDWMDSNYHIQFNEEERLLKLEFHLPPPNVVKVVKTARFVSSTGEIKETYISEREQKTIYDDLCYQIALRSTHELFEADIHDNIASILFNGVVEFVERTTGQMTKATILSAVFEKHQFECLNLTAVDPKACFKSFKGVAASSLIGLTPINPIMQMHTEDRRFVEARDVNFSEIEAENLAAMDWEEFEHLVRAIFEKEFAVEGGEVKITQASADGGVDALVFDPDPIRGGKIIIQAKRYTKTVGVAAVRELFGTVVNEGAMKGILVTTADYGSDAYKFASDKPMTLLNGGNLLYLLEKHGFRGRIDLKSARKEMGLA